MPAEHIRPCTLECDHGDRPHLAKGYYCGVCGQPCNFYATGHGENVCDSKPKLVQKLMELNRDPR